MARDVVVVHLRILRLTLALIVAAVSSVARGADGPPRETYEPDFPVRETKYYRIHTDLDLHLARDIERRLDGMYEEYRRRLSMFDVGYHNGGYGV